MLATRSVKSAARRHHSEVGDVLAVYRDRPQPVVIGGFVLVWLIFSALTLINPPESAAMALIPAVVFAVVFGLIYLYVGSEALLVCERGLIIGSLAPGMKPYVIGYHQIIPGTVAPVTGARRYGAETAQRGFAESTVRRSAGTGQGIHFVGPSAKQARRHRAVFAQFQDAPPHGIQGSWVWFAGTGSTPPQEATAQIARAAAAAGLPDLAEQTAAAQVRELTGNPGDAALHLPGYEQIRR